MKDKTKKRFEPPLLLKINNLKLYCIFFAISLVIITISQIHNFELHEVLENISYSLIAATFMACLIDYNNLKQKEKYKNEFREMYFKEINHYLTVIVEQLLWFEENLENENINWDLEPKMILINISGNTTTDSQKINEITFNEAISRLEKMRDKYLPMNLENIHIEEAKKLKKIFQILFFELNLLLGKLNKINDDKIILEIKEYANINDVNQLLENISLCCVLMLKDNHYHDVIKLLTISLKSIRKLGNYDNMVKISIDEILFNITDLI